MADKYYAWSTRLADNVEQKGKWQCESLKINRGRGGEKRK